MLSLCAVEPHRIRVAHVHRVRELAHGGGRHEAAPEGGACVGGLRLRERHARLRKRGRRNGVVLRAVSKSAQRRARPTYVCIELELHDVAGLRVDGVGAEDLRVGGAADGDHPHGLSSGRGGRGAGARRRNAARRRPSASPRDGHTDGGALRRGHRAARDDAAARVCYA